MAVLWFRTSDHQQSDGFLDQSSWRCTRLSAVNCAVTHDATGRHDTRSLSEGTRGFLCVITGACRPGWDCHSQDMERVREILQTKKTGPGLTTIAHLWRHQHEGHIPVVHVPSPAVTDINHRTEDICTEPTEKARSPERTRQLNSNQLPRQCYKFYLNSELCGVIHRVAKCGLDKSVKSRRCVSPGTDPERVSLLLFTPFRSSPRVSPSLSDHPAPPADRSVSTGACLDQLNAFHDRENPEKRVCGRAATRVIAHAELTSQSGSLVASVLQSAVEARPGAWCDVVMTLSQLTPGLLDSRLWTEKLGPGSRCATGQCLSCAAV
ncbi:hypothetical protein RRG08_011259 [Elysia crispata]|uniref:Uncharacterized protein n=1 Tax=Elysia crispata TaxID=231223 RepID=A0AAE1D2F6_9GAST|nr:hypothetical protein RRG08_011259 [Elysia crispata]